jgi:Lon protease-like protein
VGASRSTAGAERSEIPLFPLRSVLFPDGLLRLKVFEARYLDLVSACLREGKPFGVVALRRGADVGTADPVEFEAQGTLAELVDVDSAQPGILQVSCRGTQRFEVIASTQQADGLWLAQARPIAGDDDTAPTAELIETVRGLAGAMKALRAQGAEPFVEPYRFEQAGWVANRWCEILPISLAAKQKLLELQDPLVRLKLVDEYLRGKGVVG